MKMQEVQFILNFRKIQNNFFSVKYLPNISWDILKNYLLFIWNAVLTGGILYLATLVIKSIIRICSYSIRVTQLWSGILDDREATEWSLGPGQREKIVVRVLTLGSCELDGTAV